jgi:hypothetical protein
MVIIVAVATGLTALFTLGIWRVSVIAHRHDRALSGVKGALSIKPYPRSSTQPAGGFKDLPTGWTRENTRYFVFRLHNVGPFGVDAKVHVEDLRLGPLRRKKDAIYVINLDEHGTIHLKTHFPNDVWVLIHDPNGWNSGEPIRRRVRFFVHSSDGDVKFKKRVWIRALVTKGEK